MRFGNGETHVHPRSKMTMKKQPVRVSLKSLKDLASQIGPSQSLAMVVLGQLRDRADPRKFLTVDEIVELGLDSTQDAETLAQHLPSEWLDEVTYVPEEGE
jgi:hypothetical protein